jgi:alkyl sulfatase BDS1-like metallo-beta-lactamase superfamily hydrolase
VSAGGLVSALTVEQVFASIAIRIDGPRAWDLHVTLAWTFPDLAATYLTELRNGTFIHRPVQSAPTSVDASLRLTRAVLIGIATGQVTVSTAVSEGSLAVTGDPAGLQGLLSVLTAADPAFAIVTP